MAPASLTSAFDKRRLRDSRDAEKYCGEFANPETTFSRGAGASIRDDYESDSQKIVSEAFRCAAGVGELFRGFPSGQRRTESLGMAFVIYSLGPATPRKIDPPSVESPEEDWGW